MTLTLSFCIVTLAILNLDTANLCGTWAAAAESRDAVTWKRIPIEQLSTPEEYYGATYVAASAAPSPSCGAVDDIACRIGCDAEGALTVLEEGFSGLSGADGVPDNDDAADAIESNAGATEQTPLIPK